MSDRRFFRISPLALLLVLLIVPLCHAEEVEYRIKAEYLERFTRFIEWPMDLNSADRAPFTFCVVGENPFGTYLDDLVAEASVKDRRAKVEYPADLNGVESCQVLFISGSEEKNVAAILTRTENKPILTVGDTPGFAESGVLINLYRENSYVRFEINIEAVRRSGLRFNSRLLKLARIVGGTTK